MAQAKENDIVRVHYTGRLSDGVVFDSSEGNEPLEFVIGSGMLIPGFEDSVIGMALNESKTINIPADEAYGPVMDEMIQKVPREHLPEDMQPEVGMELVSETPDGHQLIVVVREVGLEHITIDANHPLAGKDLSFDIRLVEILEPIA
ncbi:MAG TPA: peptidylprolyl isomerase [Flavobacteriales bacterium]|nr:peptidylprolyl isomerase [Flavobacteriales bacterium]HRE75488.1 peptidylprolyl isomerase [Flavobacteriales bacterium]HRJ34739.1 peptidylprolyl isomerase [Flavobacteriales bacterium]HRJ37709.1 peptidylprolyl isomerase [Flavobacteriales bacterium]